MQNSRRMIPKLTGVMVALALAFAVSNFSLRAAAQADESELLTDLFSHDGLVGLKGELKALTKNPNHRLSQSKIERAARSLKSHPLNAQLLTAMGLKPGENENVVSLRMHLADRLTRREPLNQLWMIEDSVRNSDISGSLRHYHAALSTHPELYETLFPILSTAIDYPEIRRNLFKSPLVNANWISHFLKYAIFHSRIKSLIEISKENRSIFANSRFKNLTSDFAYRLAEEGNSDYSKSFLSWSLRDFDQKLFFSLDISNITTDSRLGRLSWSLKENANATTTLVAPGKIGIEIRPSSKSEIISRDFISNSNSKISIIQSIELTSGSRIPDLSWNISCLQKNNQESLSLNWVKPIEFGNGSTKVLTVFPGFKDCSFVHIALFATGPEEQMPSRSILHLEFKQNP